VVGVRRVENRLLWKRYWQKRNDIALKRGPTHAPLPLLRPAFVALASSNLEDEQRRASSNLKEMHLLHPGAAVHAVYEDKDNDPAFYDATVVEVLWPSEEGRLPSVTVTFNEYNDGEDDSEEDSAPSPLVTWEVYLSDKNDGSWVQMNETVSNRLTEAAENGHAACTWTERGQLYRIDWDASEQVNIKYGTRRSIRKQDTESEEESEEDEEAEESSTQTVALGKVMLPDVDARAANEQWLWHGTALTDPEVELFRLALRFLSHLCIIAGSLISDELVAVLDCVGGAGARRWRGPALQP
jgi:hypothetical protein